MSQTAFSAPLSATLRRVTLLSTPTEQKDSVHAYVRHLDQFGLSKFGAICNHPSEVKLQHTFTYSSLTDFQKVIDRDAVSVTVQPEAGEALVFDFHPQVFIPDLESDKLALRHLFLAKFKKNAPVEDLVNGYASLTELDF
ncbi:hypothetical protein CYMTET_39152 [Cymbomonas tetramitiformis]|uniref:Uncharacterized protein n=1 Tax=Cymbomonas tetramitiformis TaxID=36881 RepID=A0AAE0F478_9CHLO|nr:hypothetical protein CYMTET_39152 [Cymbomonas tetramitiformis]